MDPNEQNKSLETLLLENLELSRTIYQQNEKVRRYILFSQITGVIKLFLIVGPLILAGFYFTPYLSELYRTYQDLLGKGTGQPLLQGNNLLQTVLNGQLPDQEQEAAGFKIK